MTREAAKSNKDAASKNDGKDAAEQTIYQLWRVLVQMDHRNRLGMPNKLTVLSGVCSRCLLALFLLPLGLLGRNCFCASIADSCRWVAADVFATMRPCKPARWYRLWIVHTDCDVVLLLLFW